MISIIVPVYNVEPYLSYCIDSIIHQTYNDIEILLIDDGSTDASGEICESYAKKDHRIRVFHTENHGLSAARNIGLKKAEGEYIGFVDSDDWIEEDMYEVLLKKAAEFNADISECNFWFGTSILDYSNIEDAVYKDGEPLQALFANNICHVVWNKIYRRRLFDSVQFPEGHNFEDLSIMHLILDQSNIVVATSKKEYHYRQRADSIKYTYSSSNLIDYADAFINRYQFYKNREDIVQTICVENQLLPVAAGISRVWRWWYGCGKADRKTFKNKITEFKQFSKEKFPLFGYSSWPIVLRLSTCFMHSDSIVSFFILYRLNQLFRRMKPHKSNVIE